MNGEPLTLGTAGHVDHGKTTLVGALTGVDTDRLPEEKARGLTIALGYAQLVLPSGRRLSIVDVPGHERFVRTMVAGATGIDLYLMVVAADDGVMPQTIEHAAVLRALDVREGVVAVTKTDLADPREAARGAAELLPGAAIVECCARTGTGLPELLAALEAVASRVRSRAERPDAPVLHIDRVFSVRGRGTVVTGTLWSGTIAHGDALVVAPAGHSARVRGVEIHDTPTDSARAGQRVAVNLTGVRGDQVARGDVLTAAGVLRESRVLDCVLHLRGTAHGERVQVHHGTRSVAGRLAELGGELWQLRLEQPVLARRGDRLVVRRVAPPDTLGGGEVLEPHAARHGRRPDILASLIVLRDGAPPPEPPISRAPGAPAAPVASRARRAPTATRTPTAPRPRAARRAQASERELAALEQRLRDAGTAMLSEAQLGEQARLIPALRERGSAVRVSGRLYAHSEVAEKACEAVLGLVRARGSVTLAEVRDELGLSRKSTQAFLEHLDAARRTRRLPDDRRVLAGRAPAGAERGS